MSLLLTRLFGKQLVRLFLLTFTAEVPVKYNFDPTDGLAFHKFHRVARRVLYLLSCRPLSVHLFSYGPYQDLSSIK
jgi:hypothetical protein